MDSHGRRCSIGVRSHHPHNTTPRRVQASRDDTEHDILAREDTRDLRSGGMAGRGGLHDAHGRRPALFHELRDLLHGRLRADCRGLGARVHDGREVRERGLLAEGLDVREHGRRLGVGAQARPKLRLDPSKSTVELLGGRGAALDLVKGFVEDSSDIEQSDNVSLFVADGLDKGPCQLGC